MEKRTNFRKYFADMMEVVGLHSVELSDEKLIEIQAKVQEQKVIDSI
jgi:hypothetical protein